MASLAKKMKMSGKIEAEQTSNGSLYFKMSEKSKKFLTQPSQVISFYLKVPLSTPLLRSYQKALSINLPTFRRRE